MPHPVRAAAQRCKELLEEARAHSHDSDVDSDVFDVEVDIPSDSDDEPLWTFRRRQDVHSEAQEEEAVAHHPEDFTPYYTPTATYPHDEPDTPSYTPVIGSPSDSPTAQRLPQTNTFIGDDGEEYVRSNPDHPGSPRWHRRRDGVDFNDRGYRENWPADWATAENPPSYSPTSPSYSPTSPMSRDDVSASPSYSTSASSPEMPMSPSYASPPFIPEHIVPPLLPGGQDPNEEFGGEWAMADGLWRMLYTEDDRLIESVQTLLADRAQRAQRVDCSSTISSSSSSHDPFADQLLKLQAKDRIAFPDTPAHEHCAICAGTNIRTVALVPCGHVPCCGNCALGTYNARPDHSAKMKCPLCNAQVEMAYFAHI